MICYVVFLVCMFFLFCSMFHLMILIASCSTSEENIVWALRSMAEVWFDYVHLLLGRFERRENVLEKSLFFAFGLSVKNYASRS